MTGLGPGVMEIAVRHRTGARRVVHVTEIAGPPWAIYGFRKKSKTGIKTAKTDIDLMKARLGRPRRELLH